MDKELLDFKAEAARATVGKLQLAREIKEDMDEIKELIAQLKAKI